MVSGGSTQQGHSGGPGGDHGPDQVQIQIDHDHFTVPAGSMTGAQLRALPSPPLGPELDLWEDVPGSNDRLIGDDEVVQLRNGQRFFTAPATINPGRVRSIAPGR